MVRVSPMERVSAIERVSVMKRVSAMERVRAVVRVSAMSTRSNAMESGPPRMTKRVLLIANYSEGLHRQINIIHLTPKLYTLQKAN